MSIVRKRTVDEILSYDNLKISEKFKTISINQVNLYISNPFNPISLRLVHQISKNVKQNRISSLYGIVICHDHQTIELLDQLLETSANPIMAMLLNGCMNDGQGLQQNSTFINLVILLNVKDYIPRSMIIDKAWCSRMWAIASRAHLLAVTGVYFSVLGGAFCSLGKSNTKYAYKAGVLAIEQIKLARKLKDPILECKCWLYFAEDLMQLKDFDKAEKIIIRQREFISTIGDSILENMLESVISKMNVAMKKLRKSRKLPIMIA
ncbi:MAG: hypothetical protein EXX96DRAFT_312411 [Benjaminiella poitrasii]|nr:MAG: hypothetical protein EXX96DRAFT_312411 [Benjaminiella poitrasii]